MNRQQKGMWIDETCTDLSGNADYIVKYQTVGEMKRRHAPVPDLFIVIRILYLPVTVG